MHTFSRPGRKGRQHHVQIIAVEPAAQGCRVKSYWMAWQWFESRDEKKLHALRLLRRSLRQDRRPVAARVALHIPLQRRGAAAAVVTNEH